MISHRAAASIGPQDWNFPRPRSHGAPVRVGALGRRCRAASRLDAALRRAGRGRAAPRRRRQHLHRLRRRHRHPERRARQPGGGRGGARAGRAAHPHLLLRSPRTSATSSSPSAQPADPREPSPRRRCSPTAAPRRWRTRSRSPAARPAGAGVVVFEHAFHGRTLLGTVDDQQGQALQARLRALRARGLPPAVPLPLPPRRAGHPGRATARARRVLLLARRRRTRSPAW